MGIHTNLHIQVLSCTFHPIEEKFCSKEMTFKGECSPLFCLISVGYHMKLRMAMTL